jgi:selT/selW/selH-like putative selenoprotein
VKARLIKGARGVFDVKVDGRLVFSKHQVGRFPEHAEVLSQLLSP